MIVDIIEGFSKSEKNIGRLVVDAYGTTGTTTIPCPGDYQRPLHLGLSNLPRMYPLKHETKKQLEKPS